MSAESDPPISFSCPHCNKKLRAPKTLAGKNLACPKCSTKIAVPAIVPAIAPTMMPAVVPTMMPAVVPTTRPAEDEWLRLDDEPAAASVGVVQPSKPTQSQSSPKSKSVFDDDLPELVPFDAPPPAPQLPPGLGLKDIGLPDIDLEDLKLETTALGSDFAIPPNDEFSFPCRVCGSLLYALESRAGSSIHCPDCYSYLTIPKPVRKAKKQPPVNMDDLPTVSLQPINAKSTKDAPLTSSTEILEKASQAIEEETRTSTSYDGGFDTQRWLQLILGFMRDPWVVVSTIGFGLCTGGWLFTICLMGTWVEMSPVQAMIARIAIFGVLFIPIAGAICLCGLSVLTMAANRSPRVEEWPTSRMGDAIGEGFMLIAALILASIPGGMLGGIAAGLNAHPLVASALLMMGIWGLTPFLLLSMIDNGAITKPYSKPVFDSIKAFSDSWGAMYMQSALALILLFCLMILVELTSPIGSFFLGFAIPFITYFVMNQYGVLGGRISQATSLGFEGDFSEDSL